MLGPYSTDKKPNSCNSTAQFSNSLSPKDILFCRRPFNAIEPSCFNWVLYTLVRSSPLAFGNCNSFLFLYLLRTHSTISRYSCVPLSGKIPLKSSQRRQRSTVFKGLSVNCVRFSSRVSLTNSVSAKCAFSLKYLTINSRASSLVKPSISSKLSQHSRTSIPTSCRAVTTMWHFGSIRPSMTFVNTANILAGNSSRPSRTSKMSRWLWRMNSKNPSLSSLVTCWGRSWASIASQRTDFKISSAFSSLDRGRSCPSVASQT